jgi:hypothetical protein
LNLDECSIASLDKIVVERQRKQLIYEVDHLNILMRIPVDHYYSHYKNQTLEWVDADSKDDFERNMQDPEKRAQLQKYGWDQPGVITYQFNSLGFRCKEFDNSPGIITIGCSFTAGVGLPLQSIWPSLVGQALGLSVWNLGIGGASMDTCFRLLSLYIDSLNADYVLLLTPPDQRFELHTAKKVQCFHPQTIIHPIQRFWYEVETNGTLNFAKNLLAIRQLCADHNKRLIVKYHERDMFVLKQRDRWPPARDLLHVGCLEHEHLAQKFLQEIKTDQASL